ncbi:Fic family protein [Spiribacter roseus]|uniref:Fic family protein n=1 Tax=Spiribacter roseus TaxID=1855875 RepID=UPI001330C651|nr:hypothetical protein [Spiribacter roseus]
MAAQDALYRYQVQPTQADPASKEVARYADGLQVGLQAVRRTGLLTTNVVCEVQAVLEGNSAGFRRVPGTVLENERTGEVVYHPPSPERVPELISRLERYLHEETGRIINVLALVREGLLEGVALTAKHTTWLVEMIGRLLQTHKHIIRDRHRFYSQDLINNIFRHPYTKVAFLERDLGVSRATATRYLDALAEDGILAKQKLGRENYYVNRDLVSLLFNLPALEDTDTPSARSS